MGWPRVARGGVWESVGSQSPGFEGYLTEFSGILAIADLPAHDALVRKISTRRAWVVARARMLETPKQRDARGENPLVSTYLFPFWLVNGGNP